MSLRARFAALLLTVGALLALPSGPAAAGETVTIAVGDIWFCSEPFQGGVCETVISVGDTVVWDFSGASLPHTTTECGTSCDDPTGAPLWDSGLISDGSTFEFTFTEPGVYLYHCEVHSAAQRGRIIVQSAESSASGDVDCSGGVNTFDALFVLRFVADLPVSAACLGAADVNCDGDRNVLDALLILFHVAGLPVDLPPGCPPIGAATT